MPVAAPLTDIRGWRVWLLDGTTREARVPWQRGQDRWRDIPDGQVVVLMVYLEPLPAETREVVYGDAFYTFPGEAVSKLAGKTDSDIEQSLVEQAMRDYLWP